MKLYIYTEDSQYVCRIDIGKLVKKERGRERGRTEGREMGIRRLETERGGRSTENEAESERERKRERERDREREREGERGREGGANSQTNTWRYTEIQREGGRRHRP